MVQHRLLVTGMGGFVGSTLAQLVQDHPLQDEIVLASLSGAEGQSIDIRDAAALEVMVAAFNPTAVIHLAAVASPRLASQRPDEAWSVNLMGTFNLAHAVLKHAPEARFIFAGSSEAYGESFAHAQHPLTEDAPLNPLSPYGATKAAADIMLGQMSRQGLKAVRFRPFNHTGWGQPALYVIPSFARQIVRIERGWQEPLMRVGSLDPRRDFLNVRDVAQAYLLAAMAGDAPHHVGAFNLSTGNPVAIGEMLDMLLGATSASISVETDPTLVRSGEITTVSGNPRRAEEAFGWTAGISISQTLDEVLAYWRETADREPETMRS